MLLAFALAAVTPLAGRDSVALIERIDKLATLTSVPSEGVIVRVG